MNLSLKKLRFGSTRDHIACKQCREFALTCLMADNNSVAVKRVKLYQMLNTDALGGQRCNFWLSPTATRHGPIMLTTTTDISITGIDIVLDLVWSNPFIALVTKSQSLKSTMADTDASSLKVQWKFPKNSRRWPGFFETLPDRWTGRLNWMRRVQDPWSVPNSRQINTGKISIIRSISISVDYLQVLKNPNKMIPVKRIYKATSQGLTPERSVKIQMNSFV